MTASLDETFQLPEAWASTDEDDGPSLNDYKNRISCIQQMPCNETCADCSAPNPQWASLFMDVDCMEGLGAVVCEKCAVHHHFELGKKRAFIKFLKYFHEWTHPELDILEHCGNDLVNEVYEANLIPDSQERTSEEQAKFIKNKYKKCRYRDQEALEEALELVHTRTQLAQQPKHVHQHTAMERRSSSGSCLSLCSELDGTSCCLFDLEDADIDLGCGKVVVSSVPIGPKSTDSEDEDMEVSSVDRKFRRTDRRFELALGLLDDDERDLKSCRPTTRTSIASSAA